MDTQDIDPTGMADTGTMHTHTHMAGTCMGPSRMGAGTGREIMRWLIATSVSTTGIMPGITPLGHITTRTMRTIGAITMVGVTTMDGDGVGGIGTVAG